MHKDITILGFAHNTIMNVSCKCLIPNATNLINPKFQEQVFPEENSGERMCMSLLLRL